MVYSCSIQSISSQHLVDRQVGSFRKGDTFLDRICHNPTEIMEFFCIDNTQTFTRACTAVSFHLVHVRLLQRNVVLSPRLQV